MQQAYLPSKFVAFLLGFFLGGMGIHQLYLGRTGPGIVWLLVFFFTAWTGFMPIFLAIVGGLQGISYLFWTDEDWAKKHTRVTGTV